MIGYIYTLHGKTEKDIFYVGCTTKPELREAAHNNETNRMIAGCRPTFLVIEQLEFQLKPDLLKCERFWVHQFYSWGFPLINYDLGYGFDIRRIKTLIDCDMYY